MKKIFYWRFSRKIEGDFRKKNKGISFIKFYPRASLARAAFTLKLSLIVSEESISSRRRPPPPEPKSERSECLWVKKVKWSEVKWCLFWSLNFFIFRYVEGGVLGNNYIGIKKCTTFLWVLNLGQVGELP